jgi:hypothetical protein
MIVRFGRRAVTISITTSTPPPFDYLPGADDRDLVSLARSASPDVDTARWQGLTYLYGGMHPFAPRKRR